MKKIILGVVLVVFLAALYMAYQLFSSSCADTEVIRKESPDKKVEVVVGKRDCGATTSEAFTVAIVPKGLKIEKDNIVAIMDKVDQLNVEWKDATTLILTYSSARIFQFRNFWQSQKIENGTHTINVLERPN